MRGLIPIRMLLLFLGFGLFAGLTSNPLHAQERSRIRELDRTQFGIGFVANAPDEMTGLGGYVVFPKWGGLGVYVDAKFDYENPSGLEEFEAGLTPAQVQADWEGATVLEYQSSYRGFNVALIKAINPYLMAYAGGGVAQRTRYWEFEESSWTLGKGGIFWVEAPSEKETRMNMMIGVMMRMSSRISSQFGLETQPRGITAGINLRFPSW